MEHREDLTTLLAIAGRPVRVHEAAMALEIDLDEVVRLSEELTQEGVVEDTTEGLRLTGESLEPPPPSRQAYMASQWAEALAELNASPVEIGNALLAAGQFRAAGEHLLPVALSDRGLEAVEGALEAVEKGGATITPRDAGRLHLARAIHRRGRGESAGAMEDLDIAVRRLEGADLVDALGFAAAVADDLQRPQESETYTAMAASQAAHIGEAAKLGSLLTLHGRQLSRIGFPDEANRVLQVGEKLVDEHGDFDQRHRCRLNHAWVWLDRGQMRRAEAAYAILREQARDMEPVELANRDAYWARGLFGMGHAADALQAAARAEDVALAMEAEAPLFIAELARMEGATLFGRFEEAVDHADSALQVTERALPAWRNVPLVGMARALIGAGRREEAGERIDAALAATPAGVNGWRLRIQAEELALVLTPESERWPQRQAEDLTDSLLQARWFGPAVHLMAERARRESDKDLGLEGAALALQNGNPMLAALAVEAAKAWDDPTVVPVARAVRALEPQVPPEWREEWLAYPPVAGAYGVDVEAEVDSSVLEERIDQALQAAGLSGVDMVLSPAQRQARGLVRRRPIRGRRVLTVLGAAAAVVLLSGLTALAVILTQPEPTIPTTAPPPTTTIPIERTSIPVPETGLFGEAHHRGGNARTGLGAGGFRTLRGIYWNQPQQGFFGTDPVASGKYLFLGSNTDDRLIYLFLGTGVRDDAIETGDGIRSTPAFSPRIGETTYVIFGADDARVYAANAVQTRRQLLWQVDVPGRVSGSPVVVETTAVVATEEGVVLALGIENNGEELWRYVGTEQTPLGSVNTTPAYADGIVYVMDEEARLHLIDLASGQAVCEPYQATSRLAPGSNPIVADGVVYLATTGGFIEVLSAGDCSGRPPEGRNPIFMEGLEVDLPPAVVDDVIYAIDGPRLVAIDAITGEHSPWATIPFVADSPITTAPVFADGVLYIGTDSGMVYAVDARDGSMVWEFDAEETVVGSPAVVPNAVFVTTAARNVIAIAGESGTE
jgi:outer membrane protein assembly factor BamB/tetratricopeptide (TPR) repeat protein